MAVRESGSNLADEGSRGVNAKEFMRKSQWIRVPESLWQTEDQWPRQGSYENEIQESFPEVRKITANTTVIEEHESMLSRFVRFSNWQRLKTVVALCIEYKWRLRMGINTADRNLPVDEGPQVNGQRRKAESCPATCIMVQDQEQAEVEILKLVQTNAFGKEVKTLKVFQAQTEDVRKNRRCVKERKAFFEENKQPQHSGSISRCHRSSSSRRPDNEG